jgi:hypothetical protein
MESLDLKVIAPFQVFLLFNNAALAVGELVIAVVTRECFA